jgi:hypothetical protein
MTESPHVRRVTSRELLDIRERQWAPLLRSVSLATEMPVPEDRFRQVASAFGTLYRRHRADALAQWPACLVTAMTGVAVHYYRHGVYWSSLWEKTTYQGNANDQQAWGAAFLDAVSRLGLPTFSHSPLKYVGLILMHAGIPAYCLGDYLRLLLERRRQDSGLDADSFLAWATAPGRELRLMELDMPAQRFLLYGGEYAHDVVDRTLDLLDRLSEPDPDLDGVGLPAYMIETARGELAAGHLELSRLRSRRTNQGTPYRPAHPRIALDPYGQGVHVALPAVGDIPDGVAVWRITADGETDVVRSRAMWVGTAEATPQTTFPLSRPVRTVLVSLARREDLAAELHVVEPSDPVLFFGEDGRRLAGNVSLPRGQVWIMYPAERDLEFTGEAGRIAEPAVPFGWDGWRLRFVSLENAQTVGLAGGHSHEVEVQTRPRLLLSEPLPGVTTPYGSPVYAELPRIQLPDTAESAIKWQVEVRRAADRASIFSRSVELPDEFDIWQTVPRPVIGAFEVTVRGPLGRGMRRTVFVAEGLSVSYQPQVRALTHAGLTRGEAHLELRGAGSVIPAQVRFEPGERTHPVECRTATETEPLVTTPPHVAVLCPGAGTTTWTTSPVHLVTEAVADAGRLVVRLPGLSRPDQLQLEIQVSGKQVQVVPSSGEQSAGLAGFELTRAADTIAVHGRAELMLNIGERFMPVGFVRPRRLASGAELVGDTLVLREHARVDGLVAGVYLVYAPWRPPAELTVSPDGTAVLPPELVNAGPLRVLLRIDDPWTETSWPSWPGSDAYACPAPGVPLSTDPAEENVSRFMAGVDDLPQQKEHLGWLWRIVSLSAQLVRAGARADLAARCSAELRRQPRAALLALVDAGLGRAQVIQTLITTGVAATTTESASWDSAEVSVLERLWTALPAAAAIATADLFIRAEVTEVAVAQCGDSLSVILDGNPDPYAAVGRFGPEAERMAALPREQVEALWQAAAVVPQALLDADTRVMAARRMFDARSVPALRAVAVGAKTTVRDAETLIRLIKERHWTELANEISVRRAPDGKGGWLALPTMSIAMALVARLAAHGDEACQTLEREWRERWSDLALHAPDLVAIDLVLAEALIVGTLAEEPHE